MLDELTEADHVVVGSRLGQELLKSHGITEYRAEPQTPIDAADLVSSLGVQAALVVGKPDLAEVLVSAGCPVVFLDSLPFLWTDRDAVPFDVDTYCAQRCIPEPAWSVLRKIKRLVWVDSVVPKAATVSEKRDGAVLNVGGLHSPFSGRVGDAYVEVVVPPAIDAIVAEGLRIRAVCGNLSSAQVEWIRGRVPADCHVGMLSPTDFEAEVTASSLLLTSPGSTTLLQANHCGTSAIALPPQNLSQVFNAKWFAGDDGISAVPWPRPVLDPVVLESHRLGGEEEAVRYLYAGIADASGDAEVANALHAAIRKAIAATDRIPDRRNPLDLLGYQGAAQVADEVRRLVVRGRQPDNGRKVYVGGPFQAVLHGDQLRIHDAYRGLYEDLIDGFEQRGWRVFNAHRREAWGAQMLDAPTSTRMDFADIAECDVVVATPGANPASPGTHIELGWASALGKKIVLLLQEGESYAALIDGLPAVADVTFVPFRFGSPVSGAVMKVLDKS
ncbi:nucleoside 2-deoxyribosyltransferase [Streptomyces sp. NBC_01538]|uniref:nucleoside 2-deoxyribosyltransferase n=1 Tax=Streptomyces sp. NBC_01538 TaxID=2903897 RepID=UPI00386702BF